MNSTQALAKARKLLAGAKVFIEVNNRCPVGEARVAEAARRRELTDKARELGAARDARQAEVLKADAEYQRLRAEHVATTKLRDSLYGGLHHRVSIYSDQGICKRQEAAGDNFDEAIAALEAKKATA